jgi:hypothetical protein
MGELAAGDVLQLQRTVGNRAVGRLIAMATPGTGRGRIQRVSEAEVTQAVKDDATFARQYPDWLKKTQAMTGMSAAQIVDAFSMEQLKSSVSQYTIHSGNAEKMKASIWGDAAWYEKIFSNQGDLAVEKVTEHYVGYLVDGLTASATLRKYAGDKLGTTRDALSAKLKAALKVVDEATFERIFLESVKGRGLEVATNYLPVIDSSKGYRLGDVFYLRLGSGTPANSVHSPVHEFMHFLSDPFAKVTLGPDLNEGLTELITQVVMAEARARTRNEAFDLSAPAYAAERAELQKMMAEQSLSQDNLFKTYFHTLQAPAGVLSKIGAYREGRATPAEAPSSPATEPVHASSSSSSEHKDDSKH